MNRHPYSGGASLQRSLQNAQVREKVAAIAGVSKSEVDTVIGDSGRYALLTFDQMLQILAACGLEIMRTDVVDAWRTLAEAALER